MMMHLQDISRDVVETLSAQERLVIVLLHAEQLRVAEVSEVLEMPPERVIAIAALVQCRVRMAIAGGLRSRAVSLWDHTPQRTARRRMVKRLSRRRRTLRQGKVCSTCWHRRAWQA